MDTLYIVEWSLEGDEWQEKEFTNLQDAEVDAPYRDWETQ